MGAPHEFVLTPDAFEWRLANRTGKIPYRNIRRVRLSFRPINMQTYRFLTEIWSDDAPRLQFASTSWRSVVEQVRQDDAYTAFVTALHERLAASESTAQFQSGRPALVYWPGLVVFVGLSLALAFVFVRSLEEGSFTTFALIGGVFLLLLWQIGNIFRRNRPGTYRPTAIPRHVLPGG